MQTPIWLGYRQSGPKRTNFAAVNIGEEVYMIGGSHPKFRYGYFEPISLFKLDTKTLEWEKIKYQVEMECDEQMAYSCATSEELYERAFGSDVPYDRFGLSAVVYQGLIYVWGGGNFRKSTFEFRRRDHRYVYIYNPGTKAWTRRETQGDTVPLPRDGHATCLLGNHMYIFGGFIHHIDQSSAQYLYRLNLDTLEWNVVELAPEQDHRYVPTRRDLATLCSLKGKIYLFGGRYVKGRLVSEYYPNDVYVFDPEMRLWSVIPCRGECWPINKKWPHGRRTHSTFSYNDKMYIFGGQNHFMDIYFNDLWEFDPESLCFRLMPISKWSSLRESPPRRGHKSIVIGDRVYIFGGSNWEENVSFDEDTRTPTTDQAKGGSRYLSTYSVLDMRPHLRTLCMVKLIQSGFPVHDERVAQILPFNAYIEMRSLTVPYQPNCSARSAMKNFSCGNPERTRKSSTASIRSFFANFY
jgi:hypothetical protein